MHLLHLCRGETVRVELPASPIDREALRGHYDDFEAAIAASIHTCDADVLGELLERQADFPKMWNRANEKAFTRLGECVGGWRVYAAILQVV